MKYSLLFSLYQIFRSFRYQVLSSVFGITSHCKHQPTCGTVFVQTTQKFGILKGIKIGLNQLVRCW